MKRIPLDGSKETHIIFEGNIPGHLDTLNASEQRDLLTKLSNIANKDASPDAYTYEKIGNLDIFKFSKDGRIYSKVVTFVPEINPKYHIIYVLYVDEDHEYDDGKLGRFSQQAQQKLENVTDLESVEDIEAYLEANNSLTSGDLDDLLDR
ncbi:hypothetical protein K0C01_04990 [Salinarchaeum sp. IM2453]|uniref:hypothetical protein n=1 Tax=Salinarchaeum sp. IM2453 TaxID=2862870 RepID=UPI001C8339C6|nr:hypothetical protein [Salinarchaeum sp. IM2453]QZA89493.1 hypothetical protein K0C01_04990 [Salinarchaeum sp. IM2453]